MKHLKSLLVLVLALMLVGCGNKTAKVSDGSDVLIKIGKSKITKESLYEGMLEYDAADLIIKNALKQIVSLEIEDSDDITKQSDDKLAEIKSTYGTIDDALETLGYDSEDELYEDIVASIKLSALEDRYIEENYNEICETYNPLKIKVMSFTSDDYINEANEALEKLNSGMTFDQVAKQCQDTMPTETLYTTLDTYDAAIVNYLKTVTTPGTSDVLTASSTSACYIVQVTVNNTTQLKDEFVSVLTSDDDFTEEIYVSYFKAHNFTIYDVATYNLVKENYSAYLVQDED